MAKLIKYEFRKIFKSKAFYIFGILILAMEILAIYQNNQYLSQGLTVEMLGLSGQNELLNVISNCMFTTLSAIYVAILATEDDVFGSIKNIYGKGFSRGQVFFAKYVIACLTTLIYLLVSFLVCFVAGSALWGNDVATAKHLPLILLGQILILLAYISLFYMVSVITKKSGSAIAINIVVPLMMPLILIMLDSILKLKKFSLYDYWLGSFESAMSIGAGLKDIGHGFVAAFVYIILALIIGYFINEKKEL